MLEIICKPCKQYYHQLLVKSHNMPQYFIETKPKQKMLHDIRLT